MNTPQVIESALKALAGQFPVLSGVASIYGDWKQEQELKSIRQMLQKHAVSLSQMNEVLDSEYLQSSEYLELLQKTAFKAKDETRKEKLRLFADFLTSSCYMENREKSQHYLLLETVDKMEVDHLVFLRGLMEIEEEQNRSIKDRSWQIDDKAIRSLNIEEKDVYIVISYFVSIGLVVHNDHFHLDDDGRLVQQYQYQVTDLSLALIDFLSTIEPTPLLNH